MFELVKAYEAGIQEVFGYLVEPGLWQRQPCSAAWDRDRDSGEGRGQESTEGENMRKKATVKERWNTTYMEVRRGGSLVQLFGLAMIHQVDLI